MAEKIRTRFAPSPTGYLHVGGARTALYSWLYAKATGGEFILRVEDTDEARSTQESLDMVLSDLKWLGLDWQEGPEVGGDFGPYKQSERKAIYAEHADRLLKDGKAYHCFCSDELLEQKKEQAKKENKPTHYDGTCRGLDKAEVEKRLAAGEKAVVRFKVPKVEEYILHDLVRGEVKFPSDMVGDFVILRSSGMPVYNFCCAIDDALMNITHVLRAEEHLNNTLRQIMLYEAFSYPLPKFGHLSIILGEDKKKLSKRHGATSVNEYKERGYMPEAMNNFLTLLGWGNQDGEEIMSLEEITAKFGLDRFKSAAAVFDEDKLKWMNATHLRKLSNEDLWKRIQPFLLEEGLDVSKEATWQSTEWQNRALELYKSRMETLRDATANFKFLSEEKFEISEKAADALSWESTKPVIEKWVSVLKSKSEDFVSSEDFDAIQNQVKDECGVKGKFLFMPIRVAVIGVPSGAELKDLVPLIQRENLIKRAENVLEKC